MTKIEIFLTCLPIIISVAAFILSLIALCLQFRASFPKIIMSIPEGRTYQYVNNKRTHILLKIDLENVSAFTGYVNDIYVRLDGYKLKPLSQEQISALPEEIQKNISACIPKGEQLFDNSVKVNPFERTTLLMLFNAKIISAHDKSHTIYYTYYSIRRKKRKLKFKFNREELNIRLIPKVIKPILKVLDNYDKD